MLSEMIIIIIMVCVWWKLDAVVDRMMRMMIKLHA